MHSYRRLPSLACLAVAIASSQPAFAQRNSLITTAQVAHEALTSLTILPDETIVYSDGLGVFRARGRRQEQLVASPYEQGHCQYFMFGFKTCDPNVYHPRPMAAGSNGTIYIAAPEQHLIQRYDENGKGFYPVAAGIGEPTSMAVADDGSLYFNDPAGCRVLRLNDGAVSVAAGTGTCGYTNDGGLATTAEIRSVRAIALDRAGQLYIADDKAGVVRRVGNDGIIWTIAGVGTPGKGGEGTAALDTSLDGPAGLAVDAEGNLYIAEPSSNRVRQVGVDGLVRTVAGTGDAGQTGDFGTANTAKLNAPTCLAVSTLGSLRICDSDRIRKLTPLVPGRWIPRIFNPADGSIAYRAGSWLTVLGDFPDVPTVESSSLTSTSESFPTTLGGITAGFAGVECALSYVSADRIDLLLPASVPINHGERWLLLRLPGEYLYSSMTVLPDSGEISLFATILNGKFYAAAATDDLSWVTPDNPARPGQTLTFYASGGSVTEPYSPAYHPNDPNDPKAGQIILDSRGYSILQARPFSPGVVELTVQVPAGLPVGQVGVALSFQNSFSGRSASITLADVN